jgi:hypothetical protein
MSGRIEATATAQDWIRLCTLAAWEMYQQAIIGSLKPPLRVMITDGSDALIAEFELEIDSSGKVKDRMLSPNGPFNPCAFPITYAVADSDGKEWELVFSEEIADKLRKVN